MNDDGSLMELFQLRIAVKQGSNRYFVNCTLLNGIWICCKEVDDHLVNVHFTNTVDSISGVPRMTRAIE